MDVGGVVEVVVVVGVVVGIRVVYRISGIVVYVDLIAREVELCM